MAPIDLYQYCEKRTILLKPAKSASPKMSIIKTNYLCLFS